MVTAAYVLLVAAVAVQRLFEVRISRAHEAALKARGAVEHARGQMPVMIAVHTAWLFATLAEVLGLGRPLSLPLAAVAFTAFCAGQALRILAMRTLGTRWTVKVITLPGEPPITDGVFRYLRHPNYVGVILEIAALPLIHGAYLTALAFTAANGLLLAFRIRAEEQALGEASDYDARFEGRPRLVPKLSGARPEREHEAG